MKKGSTLHNHNDATCAIIYSQTLVDVVSIIAATSYSIGYFVKKVVTYWVNDFVPKCDNFLGNTF